MNLSSIAPCPFCGCTRPTVHQRKIGGIGERPAYVSCPHCSGTGPQNYSYKNPEEKAIKAWNRRIP